jgi:hypothetical protein
MILVEAAAFASGPSGGLLLGASGAGKTTLLTRLLKETRSAFVANDEVFVTDAADGALAIGAPIHVMIRRALAVQEAAFSDLLSRYLEGVEKTSVHYRDFARRMGVELQRACKVRFFGHVVEGADVRRLDGEDAFRALESAARWRGAWGPPWREAFRGELSSASQELDALRRLSRTVPSFAVGRDVPTGALTRLANG